MAALLDTVDPDGLLEYSVVFTDRSLNHMSKKFQGVMCDISSMLKEIYHGDAVALVPGGGTYGMEAVARQVAIDKHALVIRNGWFSYRWSQIFESGNFTKKTTIIKARQTGNEGFSPFAPAPIEEITKKIYETSPDVVFAPHVETSAGVILPDEYLKAISKASHDVGALFILDCIASGCAWVNMQATDVDILISAPQKGWSSTPSAGVVIMNNRAVEVVESSNSNSFAIDLKKWYSIMKTYESGGHAYHTTMPTDSLCHFRDTMLETKKYGFDRLCQNQWELGNGVRRMLQGKGIKSVAAEGFQAPGVIVSYTNDDKIQSGAKFRDLGIQIAAGVPLMCDEPKDFSTFRIGLFGLDKLYNTEHSLEKLQKAFDEVF